MVVYHYFLNTCRPRVVPKSTSTPVTVSFNDFCALFLESVLCLANRATFICYIVDARMPGNEILLWGIDFRTYYIGEWFEPRGISYLCSVIVRVKVVFRKTVVGD